MEERDFKIKIVPWIYSDEFFIIKVKKCEHWFWSTVKIPKQDLLTHNWYCGDEILRANDYNKKEALNRFSSWQDYLHFKKKQVQLIGEGQKEVDILREKEKTRLSNFYK